jgi:hypothetical protein
MRTIEEVRRLRLLQLRDEFGSWVQLNGLLKLKSGARDSTLSQIASQSEGSKTKKPKAMGSALARQLESVCNKDLGWMDTDPAYDTAGPSASELAAALAARFDATIPAPLRQVAYTALMNQVDAIAAASAARPPTNDSAQPPSRPRLQPDKTPHA